MRTGICSLEIEFDRRVRALREALPRPDDPWVLPGFVDLHVHGGGGADVMAGEAAVRAMARFHARHGTTALLATTVTAPPAALHAAAAAIGRVAAAPGPGEARVLGLHLEGPFINPARLGAQPPFTRAAEPALVHSLAALAPLRVATYAPELDPDGALLRTFRDLGVRAQLGHSDASYAVAKAALDAGAAGVTHLFNAMSGLGHREPGLAAAALAHATAAEIVVDGLHVAPGMVDVARRAIPGLYAVTDAVAASGMPDGRYALGAQAVIKVGAAVRLPSGALAGSALTMDRAFAQLRAWGVGMVEAVEMLAGRPARHLGLADRGRIAVGALADLLVLDADERLVAVHLEGAPLVATDAGTG
jgi:N-acetylglucosamine-6-phosphate deacetylase